MASIGLKYVAWAPVATEPATAVPTFGVGMVVGKAVSANLQITNAEAELYADDMLAEYVSEFTSASLTMEVDNIALDKQAKLYGATFDGTELAVSGNDNAPYGGVGGYQVLMVGGVKKYRAYFFPKAKATVPDWSASTKGASVSFGTQPLNLKIAAPNFGPWYYLAEFTTEAAAKAYVDDKLGVAETFTVSVLTSGDGTADFVGTTAVSAGGSFTVNFSAAPTAVYDNGEDKTTAVAGNAYTVAAVAGDHNIAVIFG